MTMRSLILFASFLATLTTAAPTPTIELEERALTGPNLIKDPGFENNSGVWTYGYPGPTIAKRKTGPAAASGTAYVELRWPADHGMAPYISQPTVSLPKTGSYTYTFDYAVVKNLSPGQPRDCQLEFSGTYFQLPALAKDTSYKTASVVVNLNQGSSPDIGYYCNYDEGAALVVHLDNIRLRYGTA